MQPSLPVSADLPRDRSPGGTAAALAIVRLRPPAGVTLEQMRQVAERVRANFVALPGLRCKYFAYSPERHEVVNVYVWHDSAAAAGMRHPDFVARIRAAYAGEPEISVAEVLAIAESTAGQERA